MGVLDSSFLLLSFGNDLVVVGLVAQHRHRTAWYVLSTALGSTVGVLILALIAHKLGELGTRKFASESAVYSALPRCQWLFHLALV